VQKQDNQEGPYRVLLNRISQFGHKAAGVVPGQSTGAYRINRDGTRPWV
jgi:hypothetical protein